MSWIVTCARACRHLVRSHTVRAVAFPPLVVVGASAALVQALAPPPPKPKLPCGCTARWVPPRIVTTERGAAQIIAYKAEIALASIPPEGWTRRIPRLPSHPTAAPGGNHDVPEPGSLLLLASGVVALALVRLTRRGAK